MMAPAARSARVTASPMLRTEPDKPSPPFGSVPHGATCRCDQCTFREGYEDWLYEQGQR